MSIIVLIVHGFLVFQLLLNYLLGFFLALLGVSDGICSGVVYSSNWRTEDGLNETEPLTCRSLLCL